MPENKVVYGLTNCYYSVVTEADDGTPTYAPPVRIFGAVEMSMDAKGDTNDFYADDILFYTTVSNQGYDGSITFANIPDTFRSDVLGETLVGTDNVLTENASVHPNKIALMFQFDGDQKATRHVLYNCTITRPSIASATKTDSSDVKTQELSLVAAPRSLDNIVKRSTTVDTPDAVYNGWFTAVYDPATV